MNLSRQHLLALRRIFRALDPPSGDWDQTSGVIEGRVALTDEIVAALGLLAGDKVIDDSVKIGGRFKELSSIRPNPELHAGVEIPVTDWAMGDHVIYRSLDALIGRGQFLLQAPTACYLVDEDSLLPEELGSDRAQRYLRAVKLAELLQGQADYLDQQGGTPRLVFLHKVSLTLPITYDADDLQQPILGLDLLESLLESDEHQEQKRSILKAALFDLVATEADPDQRFRRLLHNLPDFARLFRERYQLFACEFDFDKVREELEEKRRDYLVRLNACFHEMGAKLLSVPVAFYIAVTKMAPFPASGSPFETLILNTVVLLAVVIVGLYIGMLLNSHRHTLDATGDEYRALLERWQARLRFAEQRQEVERTRATLDKRRQRVITYFRITSWTVFATVLVTLGLYLMRLFRWEPAIWDWLSALKSLLMP